VIGLRPAFTAGMNRIRLNKFPGSGTPQLLYHIRVLALTVAMLAAPSLYSIALWGLTNDLRLTQCFPWTVGPLSNWMIWLALAMTVNAAAASIYPTRASAETQRVLPSRFSPFGSVPRQEERQIARQLALGGERA
jgi:hypothetical protein